MKTKEEILDEFEPNAEYPSYYHESHVLQAMETYAQQANEGLRGALEELMAAIPNQTADADFWEDDLTDAMQKAATALSNFKQDGIEKP